MYEVRIAATAKKDFESLPLKMQVRVQEAFSRLERWPAVSGVKALKGVLKGSYRIRTGDWRVLFNIDEQAKRVTIFRIAHRREVYD